MRIDLSLQTTVSISEFGDLLLELHNFRVGTRYLRFERSYVGRIRIYLGLQRGVFALQIGYCSLHGRLGGFDRIDSPDERIDLILQ